MPIRFRMIALITLGTMINYIDRVNISVAAPEIMKATGWDEARFGWVFSSFLIGYALLQYPGGVLADRWSPRKVVGISCVGFSVFTALTPLGQSGFLLLLVLRFLVGSFESLTFPSLASLNARWIPRREFARAQSMVIAGVYLGQIVAYPSTTWIIDRFSWEVVFYVNAMIGTAWVVAWLWFTTDSPRTHPLITEAELQSIESDLAFKGETVSVTLGSILRNRTILLLCASYMLFGFVVWIFILWFPTYLVKDRGLTMMQMGLVGMLPIAAGFLGVMSGGQLSDALLKRGWSPRSARVRAPGVCAVLAAPFLVLGVMAPSITGSLAGFGAFYFLFSLILPAYWALPLELNPRCVGAITGVMNASGVAAGLFGPLSAGYLVAGTGEWALPFYLAAGLCVLCGLIYTLFVEADPIELEIRPTR